MLFELFMFFVGLICLLYWKCETRRANLLMEKYGWDNHRTQSICNEAKLSLGIGGTLVVLSLIFLFQGLTGCTPYQYVSGNVCTAETFEKQNQDFYEYLRTHPHSHDD